MVCFLIGNDKGTCDWKNWECFAIVSLNNNMASSKPLLFFFFSSILISLSSSASQLTSIDSLALTSSLGPALSQFLYAAAL